MMHARIYVGRPDRNRWFGFGDGFAFTDRGHRDGSERQLKDYITQNWVSAPIGRSRKLFAGSLSTRRPGEGCDGNERGGPPSRLDALRALDVAFAPGDVAAAHAGLGEMVGAVEGEVAKRLELRLDRPAPNGR